MSPMLFLREEEVRALLPMGEAIGLLRQAFAALARGEAQNQPRRRLKLPSGAILHSMAGACGGYFGTKIYSTHPSRGAHFHFLLYEEASGQPVALMEANYLGQIRTGAATGLATSLLARDDADVVGMIGAGFQARTQLEALLALPAGGDSLALTDSAPQQRTRRRLREIRVWSRNSERRERFAAACARDFNAPVLAAASARQAVEGAGILVTITYARDPVLQNDWVSAGAHVNAAGSNNPERRELPAALVERAGLIVVDSIEQARIESGDLLMAWSAQQWNSSRLVELSAVVQGRVTRQDPEQVTIFKSNGLGLEDVAVAAYVYERAREGGLGKRL